MTCLGPLNLLEYTPQGFGEGMNSCLFPPVPLVYHSNKAFVLKATSRFLPATLVQGLMPELLSLSENIPRFVMNFRKPSGPTRLDNTAVS